MTTEPTPGWLLIGPDATITAADEAACAILGAHSPEALAGHSWLALVAVENRPAADAAEQQRLAGQPWRGFLRVGVPRTGGATFVELSPVPASGGMSALRLLALPAGPPAGAASPAAPAAGDPAARADVLEAFDALDEGDGDARVAARVALQSLHRAMAFHWGVALRFLARPDGHTGAEVIATYPTPMAGIAPGASWPELDTAEAGVLVSGEPAIAGDASPALLDRSPLRRLPAFGMRSRMHVPLFSTAAPSAADGAGPVVGCVILYDSAPGAFSATDGVRVERALARLGDRLAAAPVASEPAPVPTAPPEAEPPTPGPADEGRLALLGEVVAGVAHELNNPLTTILGYSQLLDGLSGTERDEAIAMIEEEAQRAARIVRNLLSFARQGGRPAEPVDLGRVVRRVAEVRRYSFEVEDIRLVTHLQPVPPVLADEARMAEAVLNLLQNAHDAVRSQGGGQISVATGVVGNRVRVVVADNGPGVSAEMRSRIFEPFFTTREVGEGQGMGLATVYGVVAEHHGQVWVEETPGGGATFIIELPAMPGTEAFTAPSTVEEHTQRLLVVDDERGIRTLIREILGGAGYSVDTAANGAEALDLLERHHYDLVIADLRMPEMDGTALYAAIGERWPDLQGRVVVMTGDLDGGPPGETGLRDRVPYLEKPFNTSALLEMVRQALASAMR